MSIDRVRLGDLEVSAQGLGCMGMSEWYGAADWDESIATIHRALDLGVTLLDTADVYGGQGASEQMLGEAMQGRRDEFVVATKFGMDMQGANGPDHGARGSRGYVRRAVESSLRRLRTDYLDLYQYHEPDGVTPVEETLSVLTDLVREGKVRYVGVSNVSGWQVADAEWTARSAGLEPFVSVQNRYSLLDRTVEAEVVPACEEYGLGLLPYFPLEYGLLTGKYRRGEEAPAGSRAAGVASPWLENAPWDRIEGVAAYAEQRGVSVLDVAIAGLAAQPAVGSVISGATRGEQVRANAFALRWEPSAADLVELDEITGS
jgi:aryl-alcohol dehydrogenase-like predicted oxidoreductase